MVLQNRIVMNDHTTHRLEHTMKSFIPIREPVDILKLASKVKNPAGAIADVVVNTGKKFIKKQSDRHTPKPNPTSALNIPSRQRNPNLK